MNVKKRTGSITKIALMTAFLVVCAYIKIPLPVGSVAITGQTFGVNLFALLLAPAEAGIAIFIYLLLGVCGLPVFSGGTGGFGILAGPSGGFLVGFFVAAVVISLLKGKKMSIPRNLLVTVVVGIFIIDLFGVAWMMISLHLPLKQAILAGAVPFLPLDVLKCVVASVVAKPVYTVIESFQSEKAATMTPAETTTPAEMKRD